MRKLTKFALAGAAAAAIAGTAYAANRNSHIMDVALPGGSVAHIQYYGDVAPKVTIAQRAVAGMPGMWAPMAMPRFEDIDQAIAQMDRQMAEMARRPAATPGVNVASYGNLPAGANSVSVVSYSNGGRTCTRTTQVTSQGVGKPPKVTTNVSGDCGPAATAPQAAPNQSQPLSHT